MPAKTHKEMTEQWHKDRVDRTLKQLIRYNRVYLRCSEEIAIGGLINMLEGMAKENKIPPQSKEVTDIGGDCNVTG